jgi:hypothetical protein
MVCVDDCGDVDDMAACAYIDVAAEWDCILFIKLACGFFLFSHIGTLEAHVAQERSLFIRNDIR